MTDEFDALVDGVLKGNHRSLARLITHIENRRRGYREALKRLHDHTGKAHIIGVTGPPGAGKSTLVDKMVKHYRDQGKTVGVIAVDPSSPFTGGSLLGDRIRLQSTSGDMEVFFRSMSARGSLGGLATATGDVITALDAFGKDVIIVETVGAGQNEVEVVRTADTVLVLLMPSSGDDVQMIKAGILEIGDVFVVNKADLDGVDRTVMELKHMLSMRENTPSGLGYHRTQVAGMTGNHESNDGTEGWEPDVVTTVSETGEGVNELMSVIEEHYEYLVESGEIDRKMFERYAGEIHHLLEAEFRRMSETEIEKHGGLEEIAREVVEGDSDPYTAVEEILGPIYECMEDGTGYEGERKTEREGER
ncbi:MAG: methylmalonyl Co-A mutase-associated GTPase MeaB [Halobacteria archaeon]|nr:methylmalonyl Co-A mutase-associated GTPase MeaB [Halobacteria archaeon]